MAVYSYATATGARFAPLQAVEDLVQSSPVVFPQSPGSLDWLLGPALQELEQSEDAFQLAVFAPAGARDLPVMVFLPGGGFVSGAGTVRWYNAQNFADTQRAVVVVVNYRVGLLAHRGRVGGGNTVPEELLLALRWVQRHIGTLGGNAENVTLAGQSAGAFWAFTLAQLEEARGLFQRVYFGSLSFQPPMSEQEAAQRQALVTEHLGERGLETVTTAQLLSTASGIGKHWAGRGLGLYPSADQAVPADLFDAGAAASRLHVDQVMLSHTADEATAFIGQAPDQAFPEPAVHGFIGAHFADPDIVAEVFAEDQSLVTAKDRMIRAMTLHQIELYATELADAVAAAGKQSHVVRFSVVSELPKARSAHCFELPFAFANAQHWEDAPMLRGLDPETYDEASTQFSSLLGSFLKDGIPADTQGNPLPAHQVGTVEARQVTGSGVQDHRLERRLTTKRLAPIR
ncbi:carboxylesterase family protein [Glutamicibacter sp.]|uniref:carboxylesterase family protein n=1 Tax=Glutamicibacter sp. TaxID=1931995 RepID=UPI002B47DCDE|nr:carboxylesterase family protein [Glutamicibacter sp.]HJX76738.1 carboxylesterase family protein [Glutamicibacter sp.]